MLQQKRKEYWIFLCAAIPILVFPLLCPNDYLIHIGCMAGVNILLALGMHIVTGVTGQINMGQYGFYCVGAYCCAIATTKAQMGFWPALMLTIAVSALCGLLVGIPALKVEGPYLSLCTIGFAESLRIILNSAEWAGMANGINRIGGIELFHSRISDKQGSYYFIMAFVLISILLVDNIVQSHVGIRFRAVKDDPVSAAVLGVNVAHVKLSAFVICAVLGGIAGHLYAAYSGYITPSIFIQSLQVNFLLMIVLGGLGFTWGSVLGAVLITVAYELARSYVQYQKIAFGVLMIFLILFLRQGIMGTAMGYVRRRQIKRQQNQQ